MDYTWGQLGKRLSRVGCLGESIVEELLRKGPMSGGRDYRTLLRESNKR